MHVPATARQLLDRVKRRIVLAVIAKRSKAHRSGSSRRAASAWALNDLRTDLPLLDPDPPQTPPGYSPLQRLGLLENPESRTQQGTYEPC